MNHIVRITLEGLPERVHDIADALDQAVPDTFEWQVAAAAANGLEILLEGICINVVAPNGVRSVFQSMTA